MDIQQQTSLIKGLLGESNDGKFENRREATIQMFNSISAELNKFDQIYGRSIEPDVRDEFFKLIELADSLKTLAEWGGV